LVAIAPAVTVKPAEVAPAATVTDDGADSSVLFEASATVDPPVGAAALSVAVQVVEPFDAKLLALHSSDVTVAAGAPLLAVFCAWNPPIVSSLEKYPPP
jgi:hypothetical protein